MSIKQFNQKENIQMLWDIISDEEIFKFLAPDIQSKIYNIFINNIQGFFEVEKYNSNSLVELNKKYIVLVMSHVQKNYSYKPSKITIHNEPPSKELITFEEIQNDRKSQFERDLTRRQEEFEDSMSLKTPPVPEFSDPKGKTDTPIKEIDKILKEMQAQRNYEVEQINRTYNTSNQVDNWLKPQETSLKNEKMMKPELKLEETQNIQNNRFKYLNSLDSNISPNNEKKSVSFSNNDEIKTFDSELEDEEDSNIFSKLKKIDKKEDNIILQINEPIVNGTTINNDRIDKLERDIKILNEKMDKMYRILLNKNS
jgi:hypothetical protein